MALIPKPPAVLRALARAALPEVYNLFILAGPNRIITFNKLRSWFNLGTQREARDLFNFAVEFATSLQGQNLETALGTISIADVPVNPDVIDPTGRGRRFRYEITAEIDGRFVNVGLDVDDLLSFDQIQEDGFAELLRRSIDSPKIANYFSSSGPQDIIFRIARLERRY